MSVGCVWDVCIPDCVYVCVHNFVKSLARNPFPCRALLTCSRRFMSISSGASMVWWGQRFSESKILVEEVKCAPERQWARQGPGETDIQIEH